MIFDILFGNLNMFILCLTIRKNICIKCNETFVNFTD